MTWKRDLEFVFCVVGIYFCYVYYAVLQERITTQKFVNEDGSTEKFQHTMFMMFIQCIANSIFAFFVLVTVMPGNPKCQMPQRVYCTMALTYIGGMLSSYEALKYVNFPTTVLIKSCKMLPVMLMNFLLYQRRYSAREILCVFCITAGVYIFTVFKPSSSAKAEKFNTPAGVLLSMLSLAMDGLTGAQQDQHCKGETRPSGYQLMLHMNKWAVLQLAVALALTGQGLDAIQFCSRHPEVLTDILIFAVVSAFGQSFIFHFVVAFGALPLSIVTATRKFFTILASVVWFGHATNVTQWGGVALVFSGMGWDIVSSYRSRSEKKK